MSESSFFDRIGGEGALLAAVQDFYQRVLADPTIAHFFEGIDMDVQVQKQLSFMTWAFDGPEEYKGRPLGEAHARLVAQHGLNDAHFDAVAGHLQATLHSLDVPQSLIEEAMRRVGGTREMVLGRSDP